MTDLTWEQRFSRFKAWLNKHTPIPSKWLGCEPIVLKQTPISIHLYMEYYEEKYGCDLMSGDSTKWWV